MRRQHFDTQTHARLVVGAAALLLAAGFAGVAAAQTTPDTRRATAALTEAVFRHDTAPAAIRSTPTLAYARRDNRGPAGFAQTAVSRPLGDDNLVGSVGYLCGIKPFAPDYALTGPTGAGPTSGFDRGLTFLGVKLDYAFK